MELTLEFSKTRRVVLQGQHVNNACKHSAFVSKHIVPPSMTGIVPFNPLPFLSFSDRQEFTPYVIDRLESFFKGQLTLQGLVDGAFERGYRELFSLSLALDTLEMEEILGIVVERFSRIITEKKNVEEVREAFGVIKDEIGDLKVPEEEMRNSWSDELPLQSYLGPSVSMIVEQKEQPTSRDHLFNDLKPRVDPVPREKQDRCSNFCKQSAPNFLHHCRVCARTFCNDCVKNIDIPQPYRSYSVTGGILTALMSLYRGTKEPVCKLCEGDVSEPVPLIASAFSCMGLKFHVLKRAATVSFGWRRAVIQCLGVLRKIQYHFPTYQLGKYEKRLLWNNRISWIGHDKWLLQFLKAVNWSNPDHAEEALSIVDQPFPLYSCWETMCTSRCLKRTTTDPEYALELLSDTITDPRPRSYAVRCLKRAPTSEIIAFLPVLVYDLRLEPPYRSDLWHFLYNTALQPPNTQFRTELFWSLLVSSEDKKFRSIYEGYRSLLIIGLTAALGLPEVNKILQGLDLINLCEHYRTDKENVISELSHIKNVYLPIDTTLQITSIPTDKIQETPNGTVFTFHCVTPLGDTKISKFMFKPSDVRKDYIVMNLIKACNRIFEKANLEGCRLLTYGILPTGSHSGIVEIVQNATSFNTIQEVYKQDVWHYFTLENYEGLNHHEVSENLHNSAAAYSVMSFLLYVGDRHLENIMLTTKGEFFHVDYSFILGKEPAALPLGMGMGMIGSNPKIPPSLRSPKAIKDFGGSWEDFKRVCTRVYVVLRRNYNLFINVLKIVATGEMGGDVNIQDVEGTIKERFLPGVSDDDAQKVFEAVLSNGILEYMTLDRQPVSERLKDAATSTIKGLFSLVMDTKKN